MSFHNAWIQVHDVDQAGLMVEGQGSTVFGKPKLTGDLVRGLEVEDLDPRTYGRKLFEALFPVADPLRTAYRRAVDEVLRSKSILRLKLTLSLDLEERIHRLCWERLYDPDRETEVARDPRTVFSRFAPNAVPSVEPIQSRPRLLVAIAAPSDVEQHQMSVIDRPAMSARLRGLLRPLSRWLDWEFLEPPITKERLRNRLQGPGPPIHALHLVGHGYVHTKISSSVLVLEQSNGTSEFVDERVLPNIFLGLPDLRLLTLMTCDGAVPSQAHPLSGLGRRLVRPDGLPAVLSMQDQVSFRTAEEVFAFFYRQLCRNEGLVDAALNETRLRLFLAAPESGRWSDPLLFMRLQDGALWRPLGSPQPPIPDKPGSQVDGAVERRPSRPKKHTGPGNEGTLEAVLFAVGHCEGLPVLPVCLENSQALATLLRTHEGKGPAVQTKILTNPGIRRSLFLTETEHLLRAEKDSLLFFFSGHGWLEEGRGCLVLEGDGEEPDQVFLDEILALAQHASATTITLLVDCCNPPDPLPSRIFERRPEARFPEGVTLIGCNRDSEQAEEEGKGLFTELLLNGLGGAAADVTGEVWAAALYAHAEPILSKWGYRTVFRTGGGHRPIRHCAPRVSTESLEKIKDLFDSPTAYYQLTPSHEYSHRTSVPTDVRRFRILRSLRDAGLVSIDDSKNLYFAALESRRVRLTRLGQLYWRLAMEERL